VADAADECPNEAGMVEVNGCLYTGSVSGNVNLRQGPGTTYDIVGTVAPGDTFAILGRNAASDWLQIRTMPGDDETVLDAWIFASLVVTDAPVSALPEATE
jgi:uncharacterized protein YraI